MLEVGREGEPAICLLRKLRWKKSDKLTTVELRLGNGEGGTTLWREGDLYYAILTRVALGQVQDFGRATKDKLRRPLAPFNSVSGTENDLRIQQVEWRSGFEELKLDYQPLRERGSVLGRQYAVYHNIQTCPLYVVRYRRRRGRPRPEQQP